MSDADKAEVAAALKSLDDAEAAIRRVKQQGTAITVHWIDVARLHCKATLADVARGERV